MKTHRWGKLGVLLHIICFTGAALTFAQEPEQGTFAYPAAAGARAATITIANNDSDEASYLINLSGTGATAPTGNSYLLWTK